VSVGDAATCGNEASFSFIHWRKIEQNRYFLLNSFETALSYKWSTEFDT
jgi:hypothetical protein